MRISEALELYELPLPELMARADRARRESAGDRLELCTIVNAKAGACSEDCCFCAQSARYAAGVIEYPLIALADLVEGARAARAIGSAHFGIVTSGRQLSDGEVKRVAEAITVIRDEVGIEVCASMGCLRREQFHALRDAGLTRFNHNLETSRSYFPRIVTTHGFEERLRTVRLAVEAGLSICCGGIIGMGETREDRVSMALTIKELDVDSVPVNMLIPIPGTPLEHVEPLSAAEALRTIAVFRLVMPERTIKVAAGRESVMRDFQGAAFMAGANGMIIGGYLTQKGRAVAEDKRLVQEIRRVWSD